MSVEDFTSKTYDYVICGGGTAGLVIAARLTEFVTTKYEVVVCLRAQVIYIVSLC
jgi:choline dehydrogenase-like flavoprotein